ncbi:hypothetical protein Aph01nite_74010 [Acrocarpospora phusangensis]|uniref:Phage gp6-like head-tail connector protein n=1 Tax=Acrocarpospora phusangensis TaxID=1070424 RepID=A0A919QJR1_9ACTN|nr:hypothetical protein [Acrocarpospora phusangensis]GIH29091.1 hypothetical protein Aph01nite_74010 [Acrocarpospora phusangensis]
MLHDEYADLEIVRKDLQITDTERDVLISRAITAACRKIDDETGRRFYLDEVASARTFRTRGRVLIDEDGQTLLVDDIGDVGDLVVETGRGNTWTAVTGYELAPENALAQGKPVTGLLLASGSWPTGTGRVRITTRWGWPVKPATIQQAAHLQAMRLYRRSSSPEGVAGSAEWGLIRLPHLDPDVRAMVGPYELPGMA